MVNIDVFYVKAGFMHDDAMPRIDRMLPTARERIEDIILVATDSMIGLREQQRALDRAMFRAGERPDLGERVRALHDLCEIYGVPFEILYRRLQEGRPTAQYSTEWDRLVQVSRPTVATAIGTASPGRSTRPGGMRGHGSSYAAPRSASRKVRRSRWTA